ncbi:MAG: S9 family peptidase [Chloroflexi bacterium]|nr:S9 family peptidase [Chloroflexota bacterium]
MPTSASIEQYLNIRSAYGASFSPSGRRLAFLTDITGTPQVWAVDTRSGWPDQVTFFDERVGLAEYSPTEDLLVFAMDQGGSERHQLYLASGDGRSLVPLTQQPEAIHTFGAWSPDGKAIAFAANRRNPAFFDIYVQETSATEARPVLQQDGSNSVASWSPDGRYLVVSRSNTNLDNDLYLLDLKTGEAHLLTPHRREAAYIEPRWARNGKGLYLAADQGRDLLGLAYLDLGTGRLRYLVTGPGDVESLALSPGGRRLAYARNQEGYSHLYLRDLRQGTEVEVAGLARGTLLDPRWASETTWSPDGSRLAFTFSSPSHTPDVWVYDMRRKAVRQVTHSSLAGVPRETLVEPELVHYTTFDGLRIPAFLYTPAGARPDSSWPVVVDVHGGPEAQERPTFNQVIQYLVGMGYGVLAPNVRGSTGYGKACTHLDDVRLRPDAVRDLEYAWRWLEETGWGHPKRIAVMGGSYGGFMVLAALTSQPDLWAAGVDIVGIANFLTFLQNTGPWRRRLRAAEYGDPERDAEFLREISPLSHVDRIRAPLMVIHGANDPRVPVGEAEQIVGAVRARGVVAEYLRFEDEGHGLVKRHNRIKAYTAVAAFLDRHLRGG